MYYTCKMYKDYFNHGTIAQKQPLKVFCKKRCSKQFRKFHRKTPVLASLFK